MEERNIYQDIAQRTQGDIYVGIVGPVRTGKSTFIKRFMDTIVLPNITSEFRRERANDELPQSSAGRTIMTTEPKFIPEEAVDVELEGNSSFKVRLIDCVGYIVPSSLGYVEGDQPRMVMTPWYEEPVPFNLAAEVGTKKVISEHSTIGLVITTDGSISDIPRDEYEEAEERVIEELKEINKPFIVLLNCMYPNTNNARELSAEMSAKYGVPVIPVNCLELDEEDVKQIIAQVLFEFPVKEVSVDLPRWITTLGNDHWLRNEIFSLIKGSAGGICHIRDLSGLIDALSECEHIERASQSAVDLGKGCAKIDVSLDQNLFYQILAETTGLDICGEQGLMSCMMDLAQTKKEYMRVKSALDEVEATGYGIVMPAIEELTLEEPEIMHQSGRYGVRLKASAPSIHMMKCDITTEVLPFKMKVSTQRQKCAIKITSRHPGLYWDSCSFFVFSL